MGWETKNHLVKVVVKSNIVRGLNQIRLTVDLNCSLEELLNNFLSRPKNKELREHFIKHTKRVYFEKLDNYYQPSNQYYIKVEADHDYARKNNDVFNKVIDYPLKNVTVDEYFNLIHHSLRSCEIIEFDYRMVFLKILGIELENFPFHYPFGATDENFERMNHFCYWDGQRLIGFDRPQPYC